MKAYLERDRALIVVIILAVLGGYFFLIKERFNLKATEKHLNQEVESLKAVVLAQEQKNNDLNLGLENERRINDEFKEQIGDISDTVGDLEKLRKLDKELLQKYSKVYFLNENYIPDGVSLIEDDFVYEKRDIKFHSQARSFLEDMLEDAKDDDLDILISSGYRSFDEQINLKLGYKVTYGSGANAFSADQGYSEHQLGTTVDLTTKTLTGALVIAFDQTKEFEWLVDNAYKYGFILSYPKGNSFYQYEPWHWRFVGEKLAREIHKDKTTFYNMDQREIDTFLINIFD
ncbi:MAG: D-alanyl-D-alanine carboxypeptidase [Parcubacteria bacterium C7867-005]|nr:MAG: D-alanyl-D-alanine carboxypeptidase [Parcubacteria bacterium C7867-005]